MSSEMDDFERGMRAHREQMRLRRAETITSTEKVADDLRVLRDEGAHHLDGEVLNILRTAIKAVDRRLGELYVARRNVEEMGR